MYLSPSCLSIGHASCLSTANLIVYRTLLLFVCKSRASNQYRQDAAVTPGISSFLFYVIVWPTSHSFSQQLFADATVHYLAISEDFFGS